MLGPSFSPKHDQDAGTNEEPEKPQGSGSPLARTKVMDTAPVAGALNVLNGDVRMHPLGARRPDQFLTTIIHLNES
jgi:hypothetical protein